MSGNATLQKGLATGRFLSYRSFHLRGLKWYSPSVGVMLLGICGAIYFFGEVLALSTWNVLVLTPPALTLGPKP